MLEKQFFTENRKEQLTVYPDLKLAEEWGKYCLIPLDIPRFDYPELVQWFFQVAEPSYKQSPDVATDKIGYSKFNSVDVLPTNEQQQDVWSLNIKNEFMEKFRYVYDDIMEYFPFKTIQRIRMWQSTNVVSFHRDQTKFVDFPGAFRILLYDENPNQTLSLIDALPDQKYDFLSKKFFIPRLDSTNSYVWNNLRTKHGSNFIPGFRKIIIILDRYEIDIKKYKDLIERSIDKYRNNCLVSMRNKNEYLLQW